MRGRSWSLDNDSVRTWARASACLLSFSLASMASRSSRLSSSSSAAASRSSYATVHHQFKGMQMFMEVPVQGRGYTRSDCDKTYGGG